MLRRIAVDAPVEVWSLATSGPSESGPDPAWELLRRLLATRLGLPARELRFGREACPLCGGDHGRPALAAPAGVSHFSISRTHGLSLVALAEVPVGVDVEAFPDPATVAEVTPLLHPAERARIDGAPKSARAAAFARVWTRKEAYLKAFGSGIAADLAAENLSGDGPSGWMVLDVAAGDGRAAAVALAPVG